jgi:hypothetical protein
MGPPELPHQAALSVRQNGSHRERKGTEGTDAVRNRGKTFARRSEKMSERVVENNHITTQSDRYTCNTHQIMYLQDALTDLA